MLEEISPYNELAHLREIINNVIREVNSHETDWLEPLYRLERSHSADIEALQKKVQDLELKNRALTDLVTALVSKRKDFDEKPHSERDWS